MRWLRVEADYWRSCLPIIGRILFWGVFGSMLLGIAGYAAKAGPCPNGFMVTAQVRQYEDLPQDLQQQVLKLIRAAEARNSQQATNLRTYEPDAVSRTLGYRLRHEAPRLAPINAALLARYLYREEPAQVARELGTAPIFMGSGDIILPGDPRQWVLETVWPEQAGSFTFISPTHSGNRRRLRLFGYEWGSWCKMYIHGIVTGTGTAPLS